VRRAEGPALFDELLSQALPATDGWLPWGTKRRKPRKLPEILVPELEPLSEVREVAHWVDDPCHHAIFSSQYFTPFG